MEVVLHPDYVIYQDNYYLGPKLTFSPCFVKINVSTACIKQEAFDLEWTVDDLIDINCQLFQSVSFIILLLAICVCVCKFYNSPYMPFLQSGTVIIKLRVISHNASQSNHVSDASGECYYYSWSMGMVFFIISWHTWHNLSFLFKLAKFIWVISGSRSL